MQISMQKEMTTVQNSRGGHMGGPGKAGGTLLRSPAVGWRTDLSGSREIHITVGP